MACIDIANDHIHYGAIACYSCKFFVSKLHNLASKLHILASKLHSLTSKLLVKLFLN